MVATNPFSRKISKKVFTWSMRLAEGDKIRNWCWKVRKLLTCLQLPEAVSYLEQRVCLVCNTGLIEDEFHLVMVCNTRSP